MSDGIAERMTRDHRRLAKLLAAGRFDEFRVGLLTHIAMEEKLLMPLVAEGGGHFGLLAQLRADHSALAALTIPSPRPDLQAAITDILATHDLLEEGPNGLYALCERLAGNRADEISTMLANFPAAKPSPHRDGAAIERHLRWALEQRKST